jgi:hypothetical protein
MPRALGASLSEDPDLLAPGAELEAELESYGVPAGSLFIRTTVPHARAADILIAYLDESEDAKYLWFRIVGRNLALDDDVGLPALAVLPRELSAHRLACRDPHSLEFGRPDPGRDAGSEQDGW